MQTNSLNEGKDHKQFGNEFSDTPQLLSKIEASKSKDWPGGLAYAFVAKLMKKYKLDDTLAVAEQTTKLMSLKLKKNEDPETLGDAIVVLEMGTVTQSSRARGWLQL